MKYLVTTISLLFFSNLTLACEFFEKNYSDTLKNEKNAIDNLVIKTAKDI